MNFRLGVCVVAAWCCGWSHALPTRSSVVPPEVSSQCPYTPAAVPLLLPNPVDCNSFYTCGWYGTATLQHCPPTLHFNAGLQVCDYPATANCVPSTPAPTTPTSAPVSNVTTPAPVSKETTPAPVSNMTTPVSNVTTPVPNVTTPVTVHNSSTPAAGGSSSTSVAGGSSWFPQLVTAPAEVAAECPYTPGAEPLLLPNPADCGSFYMCSWYGTAYLQHCPAHLHFNVVLQVCDSPATANCVESTTAVPPATTAAPSVSTEDSPATTDSAATGDVSVTTD